MFHPWKSVSDWERTYYEEGKEALYEERRGRARKMKAKNPRKKQKGNPRKMKICWQKYMTLHRMNISI